MALHYLLIRNEKPLFTADKPLTLKFSFDPCSAEKYLKHKKITCLKNLAKIYLHINLCKIIDAKQYFSKNKKNCQLQHTCCQYFKSTYPFNA